MTLELNRIEEYPLYADEMIPDPPNGHLAFSQEDYLLPPGFPSLILSHLSDVERSQLIRETMGNFMAQRIAAQGSAHCSPNRAHLLNGRVMEPADHVEFARQGTAVRFPWSTFLAYFMVSFFAVFVFAVILFALSL
jgi:hypothetical protein